MAIRGARPPAPTELVRAGERVSFLYVEHTVINRQDNAVTLSSDRGVVHVPAAQLSCLLIGPGCRITHHAVMLLADSGTSAVWVGEKGVRFYAAGRGLTRSSRLLEAQARLVTNERSRLQVARAMYEKRFPDEDVSRLTMQQLRGREGARVRRIYRDQSDRTGVPWHRRDYRPDDFDASDDINKALSAAHAALYGIVHATIVALGCSPGLGFVHTGGDLAFVHDIADLYKADSSIPAAFDVVASNVTDVAAHARRRMRDALVDQHILQRCVADIRDLILRDAANDLHDEWENIIALWDTGDQLVAGGVNYAAAPNDSQNRPVDW